MRFRRIASSAVAALALTGLLVGPSAAQDAAPAAGGFEDDFLVSPLPPVNGDYIPLVAPFCLEEGDGIIFWYAPGPAQDYIWRSISEAEEAFSIPVTVNGTYTPVVGDFDGNGCADILWYGPGSAKDSIWYGENEGGFTAQPITINGTYTPLVNDYDVDTPSELCEECDDIFWYSTTDGNESIWLGTTDRTFATAAAPQISYSGYRATTANLGMLFFHRPGPGADYVWGGVRANEPAPEVSVKLTIDGTYEPYFISDTGILLYAPGPATDRLITDLDPETGEMEVKSGTINGTYRVAVAGPRNFAPFVLFHGPGAAPDSIWVYADAIPVGADASALDLFG